MPLSPKMVGLRFQAAARAAGVEHVTAHSGRVGLASELTSRGASTTDVMLAGNWKTSRMVAHYSAGATAERGAVARCTSEQGFLRRVPADAVAGGIYLTAQNVASGFRPPLLPGGGVACGRGAAGRRAPSPLDDQPTTVAALRPGGHGAGAA